MEEQIITLTLQEDSSISLSADEYTKGDKGDAATIEVGTVTTVDSSQPATIVNRGTDSAAIFDFEIPQGPAGEAATIEVGTVTTGDAGTEVIVENTGSSSDAVFNFTIPKGDVGPQGETGPQGRTATITVGTVTTGAPGSEVIFTNVGTENDAIFNITIPAGVQGIKGDTGKDFSIEKTYMSLEEMNADKDNIAEGDFVLIASTVDDPDNSKLYVKGTTDFVFLTDLSGAQGFKGETGDAATITMGIVTTVSPTASASVVNVGDEHNAVFNMEIPQGATGPKGDAGEKGDKGDPLKYEDLTEEQKQELISEIGASENWATVDYVNEHGGKIDTISLNGTALVITTDKNVDIPATQVIIKRWESAD